MLEVNLIDFAILAAIIGLAIQLHMERKKAVSIIEAVAMQTCRDALVDKQIKKDLDWVYEVGLEVGASKHPHVD